MMLKSLMNFHSRKCFLITVNYVKSFTQVSLPVLTVQPCDVSVVVGVHTELEETSVDDVERTEDVIVSQWRDVSADERHEMREKFDDILRPLGFETSLLVIRRANSLALFFLCMTLSAVTSLRDQWRTRRLRRIIESLFTFLSGNTDRGGNTRQVWVKRLTWPLIDYERCLEFFHSLQSKQMILS